MPRTVTSVGTLTPVRVTVGGRDWNGHYVIRDGEVRVESAYGSDHAPLGRKNADKLAEALLAKIVKRLK